MGVFREGLSPRPTFSYDEEIKSFYNLNNCLR